MRPDGIAPLRETTTHAQSRSTQARPREEDQSELRREPKRRLRRADVQGGWEAGWIFFRDPRGARHALGNDLSRDRQRQAADGYPMRGIPPREGVGVLGGGGGGCPAYVPR